ncbi:spore coat protein U domain-containing protein [Halovulum dunhuangense]|uniref:Spore coat protein U domain-containing protein n=1 Tax=Halovulum dunhuangense TaxID=1505036 RepID=A0A849L6G3_9RHOB|nr:spore coat U domain-containing protein [Halovulum dunhuangense]NNU82035.1 spore coat protein U domain-containing protein [Halovulum dunhuangense]
MKTINKNVLVALAAGSMVMGALPVLAASQTAPGSMTVSATVVRSCSVSADALSFGNIDDAGTPVEVSADVTVSCGSANENDAVTIAFSGGLNPDGTTTRQMVSANDANNYIAYTLSEATNGVTPIAIDGTVQPATSDGGVTYTKTIYGQTQSGAAAVAGSYSDTVTLTVTYDDAYVAPQG